MNRGEVWWPVCRTMRAYRLAGTFRPSDFNPRSERW